MNDILARILELTYIPDNSPDYDTLCRARLKDIKRIIEIEVQSEAACDNTMLDYEYEDHPGDWLFRLRERLACWIAP